MQSLCLVNFSVDLVCFWFFVKNGEEYPWRLFLRGRFCGFECGLNSLLFPSSGRLSSGYRSVVGVLVKGKYEKSSLADWFNLFVLVLIVRIVKF